MKNKSGIMLWLIALGTIAIILGVTLFSLRPPDADIQKSLAETRQTLRDQGFKTDVADFDFSSSGDPSARAEDLVRNSYSLPRQMLASEVNLMPLAGADSVAIVWRQDFVHIRSDTVDWATLHQLLDPTAAVLDADVGTDLSGPFSFNLDAHDGFSLRLPHLAALRNTSLALADRTMLELHDGHDGLAWTNLLALTHLVSDWDPEPIEISQLSHCSVASTAFNATWQILQKRDWTDDQLTSLQQEWGTMDFFHRLPDTAAFRRAAAVLLCQQNRNGPVLGAATGPTVFGGPPARPSISSVSGFLQSWQEARYRSYGTYADEKNLLLFYRDREVEIRNAIKATNWLQMQAMPGITNAPSFVSPYPSRLQLILNTHDMGSRVQRLSGGLFGRAAVTETRRRMVITAITLERYRLRHQAYPATLAALTSEFPDAPTIDFMDGNPLRYRLTDDGHFVLYSVGLDGVDNGGTLSTGALSTGTAFRAGGGRFGFYGAENTDIVWPRPATDGEMKILNDADTAELKQESNGSTNQPSAGPY